MDYLKGHLTIIIWLIVVLILFGCSFTDKNGAKVDGIHKIYLSIINERLQKAV